MYSFLRQVRPLAFVVLALLALVIFSSGSQLFAQSGDRPENPEIDKSRADTLELMAAMDYQTRTGLSVP
jgi:hypothetical protein